ncbi:MULTISPECIES: hypothetical protein [unclassified Streptomyces]|uniref:hypothetical protein n=1 Tax=unclassified Streptomyces TaxID=2593676 RepID=UPI0033CDD60C
MKRTTTIDKNATAPTGHLPFVVQAAAERAAIESADLRGVGKPTPAPITGTGTDTAREHAEPLATARLNALPEFGLPSPELLYAELSATPEGEDMLISLNSQENGALVAPERAADYARRVIAWGQDVEAMAERATRHNAVGPSADAPREHPVHDEPSLYYLAAAAFIGRSIETEALSTDDVASTLDNCADALPHIMPAVFANLSMGAVLEPELRPLLDEWLRIAARMHRARATASEAVRAVLDIMLDAIRGGADPGAVGDRVLELIEQARA